MKAHCPTAMRLINFNFCLFIHTSVLCSLCIPADPAVIALLLLPDWLGALAVMSNILVCSPIRVVCFVCVSKCCGCHFISRITIGLVKTTLHSITHSHTHTLFSRWDVVEYLVQHGNLGVPVSVMYMAVVLACAGACCPPLGSVRPALLSPHILLTRTVAASHF